MRVGRCRAQLLSDKGIHDIIEIAAAELKRDNRARVTLHICGGGDIERDGGLREQMELRDQLD